MTGLPLPRTELEKNTGSGMLHISLKSKSATLRNSLNLHIVSQLLELCGLNDSHTVVSIWYLLAIYYYTTITSCLLLHFSMLLLH